METEEPKGKRKAVKKKKTDSKPRVRRPFMEGQISAERAFETAASLVQLANEGEPFTLTEPFFQQEYEKTSRRRKAKLNDAEFLKQRLRELGEDV